jgi:DNA repair protein RadA
MYYLDISYMGTVRYTQGLVRFSMGSAKLDTFLDGGIETQAVTEIAGEFGTGKSQICHTLCVTANTQKEKPRSSGSSATTSTDHNVIFIDTENTFRLERVHQIAERKRKRTIGLVEEILKRIFVCKIYNSAHLEYVIANLGKSIEQCGIIFMHFQLAHPTDNLLSEKKS